MGVKINLEDIGIQPKEFLKRLGLKLIQIFEYTYNVELDKDVIAHSIENMITAALELQTLDISYRRIFVIGIIESFQHIRENKMVIGRADAEQILRSTVKMLSEKEKKEVEKAEF